MSIWKKSRVKSTLENKLGIVFKAGKELNGWFIYKGKKILRVTIPKGRGDLKPKTQEDIRSKLRLNEKNFDTLNNCPLRLKGFIEILRAKNVIID